MLKLFAGKDILFLENDNSLYETIGNLEDWLIESKIRYNALFDIESLSLDYIMKRIEWSDIICFETQWVYPKSFEIKDAVSKMKQKKTIVEVYVDQPTWRMKPKEFIHDVYTISTYGEDMDEWNFEKLKIRR